ncbi:MAG: GTP-binding protein [Candidatus Thermoplasmatota archaeon]
MQLSEIEEEIKKIEKEIFETPKNKATEHHIGKLKAKIAKLRREAEQRKKEQTGGEGFNVKKSGDSTVGFVGYPSAGKSTLLNKLTGAKSEIGHYEFTTIEVIPGIMKYKGAKIQILDLPGLIKGASKGRGRGKEILSAVRNVDLILFIIDAQNKGTLKLMNEELYKAGIRINQKRPDVSIQKTGQGGINVTSTVKQENLTIKTIKSIVSEYYTNATVSIREKINEDQLIDVLNENRVYVSAITILNKKDKLTEPEIKNKIQEIEKQGWKVIPVSAKKEENLENLKEQIFKHLKLIRIYMKPVGEQVDKEEPLILKKGDTIEDACKKIHKDFKKNFRYATVTGPSAKHELQQAGLSHKLKDEDILTIVVEK